MKILYVDNDSEDIDIFCEAIREIDPTIMCKTLRDGHQVIQELTMECPDFIFLDSRMPMIDGKALLRQIQTHECLKTAKVVIYSGYLPPNYVDECKKLGAYDYVEKIPGFEPLIKVLREVLGINNM